MLIDNVTEIKKHNSAIGAQVVLPNVQSYIDDAINNHLIPAIGLDQYNELVNVKASGANDKQKRVIDLLQKSVVGFMIYYWADQGAVQISNTGIHVTRGTTTAPASDKKIIGLKKQNIAAGYNSLEMSVSFLNSNVSDFPVYQVSDERKENQSLLINTAREFQAAGVNINNDARLYQTLRITQEGAEDTYLMPVLGTDIMDTLHTGVVANNLNDVQQNLLKKVRKAIAFYTMAEAIPYMAMSIDATGIFQLSETVGGISGNVENRSTATDQRLATAMNSFYCTAEQHLEGIRKFLKTHKEDFSYQVPVEISRNDEGSNVYFF